MQGSGKTWTMGTSSRNFSSSEENCGIVPRVITQVFDTIRQTEDGACYKVRIQFLEIYGDEIRDLLHSDNDKQPKISILESENGEISIKGAKTELVDSATKTLLALEVGTKIRMTAVTKMNNQSSRSHGTLIYLHYIYITLNDCLPSNIMLVFLALRPQPFSHS